jgi:hypothetical protein
MPTTVSFVHLVDPKKHSCYECHEPAGFKTGTAQLLSDGQITMGTRSRCGAHISEPQRAGAVPAPKAGTEYRRWMDSLRAQLSR